MSAVSTTSLLLAESHFSKTQGTKMVPGIPRSFSGCLLHLGGKDLYYAFTFLCLGTSSVPSANRKTASMRAWPLPTALRMKQAENKTQPIGPNLASTNLKQPG